METVSFTNFITKGFEAYEDKDGKRIVKGHITAEIVDRQNEFIAVSEVLDVMKNYMEVFPAISDYHSNRMVGKTYSYKKSEIEGTPSVYVEAEIFKKSGVMLYDIVWQKILKGDYKGFSLGGASKDKEPIVKDGKLAMSLKNLELYEIALCPYPANPLAIIDYVNVFAKAANLPTYDRDGRNVIQCSGVTCFFEKSSPDQSSSSAYGHADGQTTAIGDIKPNPKVEENKTKKYADDVKKDDAGQKGTNVDVDKDIDNNGGDFVKNSGTQYLNTNEKFILGTDMSENPDNVKKSEEKVPQVNNSTVIQKDFSNEISLLITNSKQNSDSINKLTKAVENLTQKVEKTGTVVGGGGGASANPVETGNQADKMPKVTDKDDIGAPSGEEGVYAPKGDAQASIVAPAGANQDTNQTDVSKADEKKDEKKDEDKEKKVEKSDEVKKSSDGYQYIITKAARPKLPIPDTPENSPSGYQLLKAITDGWGGKHKDIEQSYIEAYNRLLKGEFGSGFVQGAVY